MFVGGCAQHEIASRPRPDHAVRGINHREPHLVRPKLSRFHGGCISSIEQGKELLPDLLLSIVSAPILRFDDKPSQGIAIDEAENPINLCKNLEPIGSRGYNFCSRQQNHCCLAPS